MNTPPPLPPGYELTDEAKDRLALMAQCTCRAHRQLLKKRFAKRDTALRRAGTPFQTLRRAEP
jgi:hypothetical protein